jgi:hypothetical protein
MSNTREKSFAEVWSSAQHARSRYFRWWLRCAYRYVKKRLTHRLNAEARKLVARPRVQIS